MIIYNYGIYYSYIIINGIIIFDIYILKIFIPFIIIYLKVILKKLFYFTETLVLLNYLTIHLESILMYICIR